MRIGPLSVTIYSFLLICDCFLHYENDFFFFCIYGINALLRCVSVIDFQASLPDVVLKRLKGFHSRFWWKWASMRSRRATAPAPSTRSCEWFNNTHVCWKMSFWRLELLHPLLSDFTPETSDTAPRPNSSDSCKSYWSSKCGTVWKPLPLLFEWTRSPTNISQNSLKDPESV